MRKKMLQGGDSRNNGSASSAFVLQEARLILGGPLDRSVSNSSSFSTSTRGAIQPLRFALQYAPPTLVVEYCRTPVAGDGAASGKTAIVKMSTMGSTAEARYHHSIVVPQASLARASDDTGVAALEKFLRKKYPDYLRASDRRQVRGLLAKLRSGVCGTGAGTNTNSKQPAWPGTHNAVAGNTTMLNLQHSGFTSLNNSVSTPIDASTPLNFTNNNSTTLISTPASTTLMDNSTISTRTQCNSKDGPLPNSCSSTPLNLVTSSSSSPLNSSSLSQPLPGTSSIAASGPASIESANNGSNMQLVNNSSNHKLARNRLSLSDAVTSSPIEGSDVTSQVTPMGAHSGYHAFTNSAAAPGSETRGALDSRDPLFSMRRSPKGSSQGSPVFSEKSFAENLLTTNPPTRTAQLELINASSKAGIGMPHHLNSLSKESTTSKESTASNQKVDTSAASDVDVDGAARSNAKDVVDVDHDHQAADVEPERSTTEEPAMDSTTEEKGTADKVEGGAPVNVASANAFVPPPRGAKPLLGALPPLQRGGGDKLRDLPPLGSAALKTSGFFQRLGSGDFSDSSRDAALGPGGASASTTTPGTPDLVQNKVVQPKAVTAALSIDGTDDAITGSPPTFKVVDADPVSTPLGVPDEIDEAPLGADESAVVVAENTDADIIEKTNEVVEGHVEDIDHVEGADEQMDKEIEPSEVKKPKGSVFEVVTLASKQGPSVAVCSDVSSDMLDEPEDYVLINNSDNEKQSGRDEVENALKVKKDAPDDVQDDKDHRTNAVSKTATSSPRSPGPNNFFLTRLDDDEEEKTGKNTITSKLEDDADEDPFLRDDEAKDVISAVEKFDDDDEVEQDDASQMQRHTSDIDDDKDLSKKNEAATTLSPVAAVTIAPPISQAEKKASDASSNEDFEDDFESDGPPSPEIEEDIIVEEDEDDDALRIGLDTSSGNAAVKSPAIIDFENIFAADDDDAEESPKSPQNDSQGLLAAAAENKVGEAPGQEPTAATSKTTDAGGRVKEAPLKTGLQEIPSSVYSLFNIPPSEDLDLIIEEDDFRLSGDDSITACLQAFVIATLLSTRWKKDPEAWAESASEEERTKLLAEATRVCLTQSCSEDEGKSVSFPTNAMFFREYDAKDPLPIADDFTTEKLVLSALLTHGIEAAQAILGKGACDGAALTNLLLTGSPAPFCFDGKREGGSTGFTGGLSGSTSGTSSGSGAAAKSKSLQAIADGDGQAGAATQLGVEKRSYVGFLSKFCEVGDYLKNPIMPVWVLQETNDKYSVLYAKDESLGSGDKDEKDDASDAGSVASESGVDLVLVNSRDALLCRPEKVSLRAHHLAQPATGDEEADWRKAKVNALLRLKWGDRAGIQWLDEDDA
ncbi:unnamed protein product [Amoebophrya sp. A25]|nr:unnamed protein product [Amoebophrya sp. A25]|eukprot:GSA25T00019615001.1